LFRTGEKSSCNPTGSGRDPAEIPGPNVWAAGFDPFHEIGAARISLKAARDSIDHQRNVRYLMPNAFGSQREIAGI
jgi:hypothetical protein